MRIDAGDVDKPIGIKDPQPPIMEFDDAVLLEVAQNPVDVDSRETRRVPDMLLRERQVHFLPPNAWPLGAATDKKFEEQVSHALAGAMATYAGEAAEGELTVS